MSKFLLRNLKNERRRIEKELNKVDKEIARVEGTEVIMEGSLDLKSLVKVDKTDLMLVDNNIDFGMHFKIRFERFENEVVCILTTDDDKFDEVKRFTGKAICAKDEKFDLATGMTLAQNRAVKEVYEFIIGLFA